MGIIFHRMDFTIMYKFVYVKKVQNIYTNTKLVRPVENKIMFPFIK